MKTILIVEDEPSIHELLKEILTHEHYSILDAYSGSEALLILQKNTPDLIILDLMLPGVEGEEIIRKMNHLPILVLSAKGSLKDKVSCLLNGANDYMTKPFDKNELLARIKVQLRINKELKTLKFKDLQLENDARTCIIHGHSVALTKTEYAILKQLLLNPNQVISKTQMLEMISMNNEDCDENSLRVHISNIRKKLRTYSSYEYIESVWGIGFKMKS